MNLIGLAIGFFSTPKPNGELEAVKRAGEEQGERMADAYCDGLEAGAVKTLQRRQRVWLGFDPETVDVQPVASSHNRKKIGNRR